MHLTIREIFMKVDLPLRFGCGSPENGRELADFQKRPYLNYYNISVHDPLYSFV